MRRLGLILKFLFAISFAAAGLNHFFNAAFYVHIMPPYLPQPLPLVYLSGALEIVLGVLLLIPKFTRAAAWGLMALLVAVFPANVHMAINHVSYPEYSVAALWLRLPLQALLMGWAYLYTKSAGREEKGFQVLRVNAHKGVGIFATRKFDAGEAIYRMDYWSGAQMPIHATNHSCDPNASFDEGGVLVAVRGIEPGEEITYDYVAHPLPASPWNFKCGCGAERCVGWIDV